MKMPKLQGHEDSWKFNLCVLDPSSLMVWSFFFMIMPWRIFCDKGGHGSKWVIPLVSHSLKQWFSKYGTRPAASAAFGNLLETKFSIPSRSAESETLVRGPSNPYFNKPSWWFRCTLNSTILKGKPFRVSEFPHREALGPKITRF